MEREAAPICRPCPDGAGDLLPPLVPPTFPAGPPARARAHWCSIWKLRCPLNQSLKKDCSTLQVAASCEGAGGEARKRRQNEGVVWSPSREAHPSRSSRPT